MSKVSRYSIGAGQIVLSCSECSQVLDTAKVIVWNDGTTSLDNQDVHAGTNHECFKADLTDEEKAAMENPHVE